jgi:hypothetical protein
MNYHSADSVLLFFKNIYCKIDLAVLCSEKLNNQDKMF